MSVYIRLNKELNPTTLIKQISKEISKYKGKLEDSFLCIDIKQAQDTVAYKGYEYNYSKGQHKLAYPETGSVYYLTNTFAEDYVPQLSEIMDVIDSWIDWSA